MLSGYNLANPRIRKLFTAVTGKDVEKEGFGHQFTQSAERRNQAVHAGKFAAKAEAEQSIKVTSALVSYLN